MATNVTSYSLQTVSPSGRPAPEPGDSGGSEIAGIGRALDTAVKGYFDQKKRGVLGSLAQEAQTAVSATSMYQQAKDNIVSSMSAADKATFDQLSKKLERLRSGEEQGVLSPQAANIRLQSLAKTYITRYPRMAGEIRQMLKLISGDIAPDTKTGDITDPVLKAQYEIVEESVKRGTDPQETILFRRQKDATEQAKLRLEQAQTEGGLQLPKLMFDLVDNKSSEVFSELISGMVGRIKNGQFVRENELTGMRAAMAQGMVDLNRELTSYELETGVRVDHKQFEDRLRSAYEPLILLANEADTLDKQKRFATAQDAILKATDYKYLHDLIGSFAQVAINSPESAFRFMEELSKTAAMIVDGDLPSIEESAKYDPKTRMLLEQLKKNGAGWEVLMKKADGILTGKPSTTSTGSAAIDRLAGKIVLDTAAKPGTPAAESSKLLANYIYSGEPIDGVLHNKRTHSVLKQSPEAQKALETKALEQLVSFVMTRPMSELEGIEIDFSDPSNPFKNTLEDTFAPPSMEWGADLTTTFQQKENKFADTMNRYVKVMLLYKDPAEVEFLVTERFGALVAGRVNNDMAALKAASGKVDEAGEDGEEGVDGDGKKVTKLDSSGAEVSTGPKKRYQYDEQRNLIIDTKRNRILPDTYQFSPEEMLQLEADLGDIVNLGASAEDLMPAR